MPGWSGLHGQRRLVHQIHRCRGDDPLRERERCFLYLQLKADRMAVRFID